MRDIEVIERFKIYTIYYINKSSAAVSVSTNEEVCSELVMELLKVAEKDNTIQSKEFFSNALIIEVADELVKYTENGDITFEYLGPKYFQWSYLDNAYEGKAGFRIDEADVSDIVTEIKQNKLLWQFSKISRKLARLQIKGCNFKKVRNLFGRLKIIYFIISNDYYDKFI